ncbi:ANTH-domain-containing protein [Tothia fuscella]|uniref:ANTH-domain-containing protein n=1 Tax=Tothia fuscella TaxID=1048955 RepID=A0A9P4P5R3_9PEZI|nr:ANTH-domain-containing protein [Tothia fuscella]
MVTLVDVQIVIANLSNEWCKSDPPASTSKVKHHSYSPHQSLPLPHLTPAYPMASSFEKSVKGGTKIKLAAPKSKYVEHILIATHAGEQGVAEVFRVLQNRLRDSTWTIVFKSLIIVHFMIREGEPNVTLRYLSSSPQRKLAINNFTEGTYMHEYGSTAIRLGNTGPSTLRLVQNAHGVSVQAQGIAINVGAGRDAAKGNIEKRFNRCCLLLTILVVQTQGRNIKTYSEYLVQRATSFAQTKTDYVREGEGRLKRLSIEKGLLRETESIQEQIRALLRCDFLTNDAENDISLTAFRLLTMDLLILFHVMNEGMVNILEHFFEMSKPDAERTLNIYRTFVKQTDLVVNYLSVARHYEHVTRLEIPKIKHAPTSLAGQLEEYVRDNDFEVMRRQYMAQHQTKKGDKTATNGSSTKKFLDTAKSSNSKAAEAFPEPKSSSNAPAKSEPKGPAPDLIDFFASIEQNQQVMGTNPFHQQQFQQQQHQQQSVPNQATGFPQQQPQGFGAQMTGMPQQQPPQQAFPTGNGQSVNPFLQMQQQQQQMTGMPQQMALQQMPQQQPQQIQTNFTGAGFGGYTPQPQQQTGRFQPGLSSIPQSSVAPFQPQPQQSYATGSPLDATAASSNPFRQSMLPSATGASTSSFSSASTNTNRQSTNPFAKSSSPAQGSPATSSSPFAAPNFSQQQQQPQQQQAPPLMPTATGANPFTRPQAPTSSPFIPTLTTNPTGSTNPFRQSQFVNQQTGQGWQTGPQGTIGGMNPEQLQTVSVFPRPGQPSVPSQQPTGW